MGVFYKGKDLFILKYNFLKPRIQPIWTTIWRKNYFWSHNRHENLLSFCYSYTAVEPSSFIPQNNGTKAVIINYLTANL